MYISHLFLVISYCICSKAKFWGSKFHILVHTKVCMFTYINWACDMACVFPPSQRASLLFLVQVSCSLHVVLFSLFPEQRHQARGADKVGWMQLKRRLERAQNNPCTLCSPLSFLFSWICHWHFPGQVRVICSKLCYLRGFYFSFSKFIWYQ